MSHSNGRSPGIQTLSSNIVDYQEIYHPDGFFGFGFPLLDPVDL